LLEDLGGQRGWAGAEIEYTAHAGGSPVLCCNAV
jgi:hypothetical protein